MKISRIFLCIAAIYLLGFFSHALYLRKTVYGDGIFYYSWMRSVVIDHDVNFSNEYVHFGASQPMTQKNLPGNKYSIGPALIWAPAFITVHSLIRGDGYTLPYQLAVGITTVLVTIYALVLLYRLLDESKTTAIFAIVAIAGATNLIFYGSLDAVNSHGVSFFISVVYLSLLTTKKPSWVAVGIALATLGMIRLQDVIFILLLLPMRKAINYPQLLLGFTIAFLPQLFAWNGLYGNFWINPYLAGGEKFSLLRPNLLGILFYKDSGLFLWTPIAVLGIIGLWAKKSLYGPYLLVCLLQLWLVASWSTWWQGASYSGRMFVSILPLASFGLIQGLASLRKKFGDQVTMIFILTFSMMNVLSITYFLLMH